MSTPGTGPRQPRRPKIGARTPTARPRKVAGRPAGTDPEPTERDESVEIHEPAGPVESHEAAEVDQVHEATDEPTDEPAEAHEHHLQEWPNEEPPTADHPRRRTAILVTVVVLLAGLAAAEGWYLWGSDDPVVSAKRPVVIGQVSVASAVDVAAKSAANVTAWSYETYDEDVEADAALLTDEFAEEFRATKEASREKVLSQKLAVTAEVAMQGVVRASAEQVVALVYLDQSATKAGAELEVRQYTILVTVLRTDSGWLISKMEPF
jgi:Mce-associated membrane protein